MGVLVPLAILVHWVAHNFPFVKNDRAYRDKLRLLCLVLLDTEPPLAVHMESLGVLGCGMQHENKIDVVGNLTFVPNNVYLIGKMVNFQINQRKSFILHSRYLHDYV